MQMSELIFEPKAKKLTDKADWIRDQAKSDSANQSDDERQVVDPQEWSSVYIENS